MLELQDHFKGYSFRLVTVRLPAVACADKDFLTVIDFLEVVKRVSLN